MLSGPGCSYYERGIKPEGRGVLSGVGSSYVVMGGSTRRSEHIVRAGVLV